MKPDASNFVQNACQNIKIQKNIGPITYPLIFSHLTIRVTILQHFKNAELCYTQMTDHIFYVLFKNAK